MKRLRANGTGDFTGRSRRNTIKVDSSQRRVVWSAVGDVGLPARRHFPFRYLRPHRGSEA